MPRLANAHVASTLMPELWVTETHGSIAFLASFHVVRKEKSFIVDFCFRTT
jgi:hypothetical protein